MSNEIRVTNATIQEIGTPTQKVTSVNGKCGAVHLTQDDVGDGETYVRFSKTEQEKLRGISGGGSGGNGLSAYEIAVKNGFEGSESEWLLSLIGETGADGFSPSIFSESRTSEDGRTIYDVFATNADGREFLGVLSEGKRGKNGDDGFSPILEAEAIFDVTPAHRIFVTDAGGKRELFWVHDGKDGADGFTPTITSSQYPDGSFEIFATTSDGAQISIGELKNGKDGADGKDGIDYVLTESDKTEIANLVLSNFTDVSEVGQ